MTDTSLNFEQFWPPQVNHFNCKFVVSLCILTGLHKLTLAQKSNIMKTLYHQFNILYKDGKPIQLFMLHHGHKCQLNPFSHAELNFHPPPKPQTWANNEDDAVLISLFKQLTVPTEANFASHKSMFQGVVTHSDSHVHPVTCSNEHYDGIVFPVLFSCS